MDRQKWTVVAVVVHFRKHLMNVAESIVITYNNNNRVDGVINYIDDDHLHHQSQLGTASLHLSSIDKPQLLLSTIFFKNYN